MFQKKETSEFRPIPEWKKYLYSFLIALGAVGLGVVAIRFLSTL